MINLLIELVSKVTWTRIYLSWLKDFTVLGKHMRRCSTCFPILPSHLVNKSWYNVPVFNFRFAGIFVNMGLTFHKADAQADLDWWSRNHGSGMPQNWPMFEVHYCLSFVSRFKFNILIMDFHLRQV